MTCGSARSPRRANSTPGGGHVGVRLGQRVRAGGGRAGTEARAAAPAVRKLAPLFLVEVTDRGGAELMAAGFPGDCFRPAGRPALHIGLHPRGHRGILAALIAREHPDRESRLPHSAAPAFERTAAGHRRTGVLSAAIATAPGGAVPLPASAPCSISASSLSAKSVCFAFSGRRPWCGARRPRCPWTALREGDAPRRRTRPGQGRRSATRAAASRS